MTRVGFSLALLLQLALPADAARFAIIDTNGTVANIVEYASQPSNPPPGFPNGYQAIPAIGSAAPGWTYSAGVFVNPNPTPALTAAQQAAATYLQKINGGLSVTSTGASALNATYPTTPSAQANVVSIAASIAASKGLPEGGSTIQWLDASGTLHTFTSSQFLDFAAAIRDFVYGCDIAQIQEAAGGSPIWPSGSATIP